MNNDALLDLKSEFVAEVLDIAQVHLVWTSRHLGEHRHDQALVAFQRFVMAVREAAAEMAAVRTIIDGEKIAGEAAAEFRAQRKRVA